MGNIIKIESISGNKVLFANGVIIGLSFDKISEYNLRKREELTQKEYFELIEIAALSTSYYLLAKRDYSRKELYQKLLLKYKQDSILKKIISILEEKGYLDDYEFAKNYVNTHRGGRVKLQYNLRLKGVPSSIVEEVLDSNGQKETEDLQKEWEKLGDRDKNKKIASLMRKGYQKKL
ncbi:MAG: regulatory protein RecX [Cetobacterium sp.]